MGASLPSSPLSPFDLFADWFQEAEAAEVNDPNGVALACVDAQGRPSVRMMLMKGWDQEGFVFYTNLESRKALEIAHNPEVALLFHWKSLRRQVRIEGVCVAVSPMEADSYFQSRPRQSQIGAWASQQSRPLPDRATLEEQVAACAQRYTDQPVPRPPHWSGYRVVPRRIEFWRDMPFRLHERQVFHRLGSGWVTERLYP